MELILYHGQGLVYGTLQGVLVLRVIFNYIIYERIDSPVTQPDVSFWRTVVTLSTKEKEVLAKRRPDIIDVDRDKGRIDGYEIFIVALTFWWPIESFDESLTKKLKLIANILNITFLILLVGAGVLYLYMQDINIKYPHVKRDWTRIFTSPE